jgi:hypothetical protein
VFKGYGGLYNHNQKMHGGAKVVRTPRGEAGGAPGAAAVGGTGPTTDRMAASAALSHGADGAAGPGVARRASQCAVDVALVTPAAAAVEAATVAGLAAPVKVELDVEGVPAPRLPRGGAPGCAGAPAAEMNAEVRSEPQHLQQVKVEIKTEVKSEIKARGQRLAKRRATGPPEGDAAVPVAKRRRGGGAAPSGGAFCRRSRPRVPGDALGCAGVPAGVDAEVKLGEQDVVKVKIETDGSDQDQRGRKRTRRTPACFLELAAAGGGAEAQAKDAHRKAKAARRPGAKAHRRKAAGTKPRRHVDEAKPEIQPPRLATRAPVPPAGSVTAPATKRRWNGGAAPSGGASCRRSSTRSGWTAASPARG